MMRESNVLKKLRNNEYVLSTQIGSAYAPFAAMAAKIGFDCVWLDLEHKSVSESDVRECILACSIYDCDTVVRIKKRGYSDYFRPLEDGATGIMVPHCKSKKEAELAVYNSKFYPIGRRGMDFTGLGSDYMTASSKDCMDHALLHTFTMLQIEDVEALNCIDEIVATKGVDLLFIGPGDLTQSAKAHGIYTDTFIEEAYKKVNDAIANRSDIWWGTVVGTPEKAKELFDFGCRFINVRGDFGVVFNGLSSLCDESRKLID